jgi:hypothetical protein
VPEEARKGAKLVLPLNTGFLRDQDEVYLLEDCTYTINKPEVPFVTIKITEKDRELNRVLVIY